MNGSPEVVVVGAGISGLATAWELLQRGRRPLVIERSKRAGGVIFTERVDDFLVDAGPDALLVQKPAALQLCRELGLGDRLHPTLTPRTAFVLRRGRLIPLPEPSVLGIPTGLGPFVRTPLFSWRGKARMALELALPAREAQGDESIGSFIGRRFGEEALTYLADPLLAGIHAGDVQRLSMRSAFPLLLQAEHTHGSVLRGLRAQKSKRAASGNDSHGAFMSLPGGIGELVAALVDRMPAGALRYGSGVVSISGRGPYVVTLDTGEPLSAPVVIVATPAWTASSILSILDEPLASLIGKIPYVSSATVAIGARRDQVAHPLNGSGFVVPRPERRLLMAGSWVSSKWPHRAPEGFVLLRGFVGGAYDPDALARSDAELGAAVFDEFRALLDISGPPLFTRVYRWPRANAQHEVGHLERMAEIDRLLDGHPGIYVTGSGFRGTGIPDCVADGRATAARADAFLQSRT
ncbi:MAG TPA: protoporphyrinogen oxidase [Vicinamibacterales bacterium]|nr:protoporphyrinogen oxidase [Vicinamibacterales bacterium]